LAVPVVSEVVIDFARPKEVMDRRKYGDRSASCCGHYNAISGLQSNRFFVDRAAELAILPVVRRVAPYDSRTRRDGDPFDAGIVLIGRRALLSSSRDLLSEQIGPFVHRVLQAARADPELHAGKQHFEPLAVRFHAASLYVEAGGSAANLLWFARQPGLSGYPLRGRRRAMVRRLVSWHSQGRVPERLPAILIEDLRGNFDAENLQRLKLLIGHAPQPRNHFEFRRQVRSQRFPRATLLPHRNFTDHGSALIYAETHSEFVVLFPIPSEGQDLVYYLRPQSRLRFVIGHAVRLRLSSNNRGACEKNPARNAFHRHLPVKTRIPRQSARREEPQYPLFGDRLVPSDSWCWLRRSN